MFCILHFSDQQQVSIQGLSQALGRAWTGTSSIQQSQLTNGANKLRVAVLISGTGRSIFSQCLQVKLNLVQELLIHDMNGTSTILYSR